MIEETPNIPLHHRIGALQFSLQVLPRLRRGIAVQRPEHCLQEMKTLRNVRRAVSAMFPRKLHFCDSFFVAIRQQQDARQMTVRARASLLLHSARQREAEAHPTCGGFPAPMKGVPQKRGKDLSSSRECPLSSTPSRATPQHAPAHVRRTSPPAAIVPSSISPERKSTCARRIRMLTEITTESDLFGLE
jgi:hypothetical protein